MAYVDAELIEIPQRTILSVEGLRGSGKTEFGLRAAGQVRLQRLDFASEGALRKVVAQRPGNIKVASYEYDRPETKKVDGRVQRFTKDEVEQATATYNAFVSDYRQALDDGATPVWDTGGSLWEIFRIARFGKVEQVPQNLYGFVNREFKALLNESMAANQSLVILHHLKEEWADAADDNGKRVSHRTGNYEAVGWGKIDDIAGAVIRLYRAGDPTDPNKTVHGAATYGHFCAQFRKCNQNGSLVGETVDFTEWAEMGVTNTYGIIMSMIYDGTEVEDWQ